MDTQKGGDETAGWVVGSGEWGDGGGEGEGYLGCQWCVMGMRSGDGGGEGEGYLGVDMGLPAVCYGDEVQWAGTKVMQGSWRVKRSWLKQGIEGH